MREILCRGQTRRFGEKVNIAGKKLPSIWAYGGIFQGTGDYSIIYGAKTEEFTGKDIDKYTVYSDTVGQYTGLKDKNGKRIFEGDIVHVYDATACSIDFEFDGVVVYQDASFAIQSEEMTHYRWMDYEIEVIGNVHDGKEQDNG